MRGAGWGDQERWGCLQHWQAITLRVSPPSPPRPRWPLSILTKPNSASVISRPLKNRSAEEAECVVALLQSVPALKPAGRGCGTALECPPRSSAAFAASGLTQVKLAEGAGVTCLSRGPPLCNSNPPASLNLLQPKAELRLLRMQTDRQNQPRTIFEYKSITVQTQKHILRHEGCFKIPLLCFPCGDRLADISLKSLELKSWCKTKCCHLH